MTMAISMSDYFITVAALVGYGMVVALFTYVACKLKDSDMV